MKLCACCWIFLCVTFSLVEVAHAAHVEVSLGRECRALDVSQIQRLFGAEVGDHTYEAMLACDDTNITVTLLGEPTLRRVVERGAGAERMIAMVLVEMCDERQYARKEAAKQAIKTKKPPPRAPASPVITKSRKTETKIVFLDDVFEPKTSLRLGGAMSWIWPPEEVAAGANLTLSHMPTRRWGWSIGLDVLTREDPVLYGGLRSIWGSAMGMIQQRWWSLGGWHTDWSIGARVGVQILALSMTRKRQDITQTRATLWGGPMLTMGLTRELGPNAINLRVEAGWPMRELVVRLPYWQRIEFDGPWFSVGFGFHM